MVFLDCVIGEMDESIGQVFHVELFAGSPDIAVLIPIALHMAVDGSYKDVGPYIEFAFLIEEGNNVLLDYVGSLLALLPLGIFLQDIVYLLKSLNNNYAVTPIGILTRFDQPGVSALRLKRVLNLAVWIRLLILLLLFDLLITFVVLFQKVIEFLVALLLYMEGHRDIYERVLFLTLVITFKVHEQGLFV